MKFAIASALICLAVASGGSAVHFAGVAHDAGDKMDANDDARVTSHDLGACDAR